MAIVKNLVNEKFTIIPNDTLKAELSTQAFKLLVYLYSLPSDWTIKQKNVASEFGVSERSIKTHFAELKESGWLVIDTKYTGMGAVSTYTLVQNIAPCGAEYCTNRVQNIALTPVQNSAVQNIALLNNTNTLQRLITTKTNNKTKTIYFKNQELQNLFIEFLEFRKTLKAKNTDKSITLLVNKLKQETEQEAIEMLNNSIMNSWKSVFPSKKGYQQKQEMTREDWDRL